MTLRPLHSLLVLALVAPLLVGCSHDDSGKSNTQAAPATPYAAVARGHTGPGHDRGRRGQADEECEVSYKDRGGKYQGQRGVTLPRT